MTLLDATHRLVPIACEELLTATGQSAGKQPSKQPSKDIARVTARPQDYAAGVIEFAGEAMAGTVVLLSAFEFFAAFRSKARPAGQLTPQSAADWVRVRDCAMELSNQLFGRLKNQLRTLGVAVEPTLPRAVSGYALLVTLRERTGAPHAYVGGGHDVFVWFEAVVKGSAQDGARIEVITEGDFVEF